jgi:large subunit ribosomal protein L10
MRQEKQSLTKEYLARLNSAPFFIAVNYTGLKVGPLAELRKRLAKAGAELHIVKNSIFRIAAQEAGIADLGGPLAGQLAIITGPKDVSAAAKTVKTFAAEFEKPKMQFGFLNSVRLDGTQLLALADLPSIEILRGKLLGVLSAPATKLVVLLNTPGSQLARVIKAKAEKPETAEPAPA